MVSPFGTPSAIDIAAVLDIFKQVSSVASWRGRLRPDAVDLAMDVTFTDVMDAVDAVKGFAFPYAGPQTCP